MTPKSPLVFVTRRPFVFAPLLWALGGCSRTSPPTQPIARGTTVLALGDSLTYGTGAPAESSYPNILAQLTGWNIVNAGVPGDTSAQALERVGGLLSQHQPALVLLCIGGNVCCAAAMKQPCVTTCSVCVMRCVPAVPNCF